MEEVWDKTKILLVNLAHFKKRNRIKRYTLPVLITLLTVLPKKYFPAFFGDHSAFLLASLSVAASSWYGGLGPGIFATLLSATSIYFIFLKADIAYHPFSGDLVLVAIFLLEGVVISIVSEARYEMENQKDDFIAFVSHELKNPLTAVKGFSGLITNIAKSKGYEKIISYAEQIQIQSNNILELINDLLDVTRIEIGKFTYSDSFFPIEDLVRESVGHQQIIAKERAIEIHGKGKKLVYGDRYRIGQVITNLLTNAIKYSPKREKIIVRLKENKKTVQISVQDFGIGIDENEQKQIFDRYYRTRDVEKKRSEGLGLGLYITNQIMKRHGGKLWVKSKKGKGSTFFISLPVKYAL